MRAVPASAAKAWRLLTSPYSSAHTPQTMITRNAAVIRSASGMSCVIVAPAQDIARDRQAGRMARSVRRKRHRSVMPHAAA